MNSQHSNVSPPVDELVRVFNTAIVATRASAPRDLSTELFTLVDSPAFRSILQSVRSLARGQQISEKEASELIIETFRKMDRIWADYVYQEGVDRLKAQLTPPSAQNAPTTGAGASATSF